MLSTEVDGPGSSTDFLVSTGSMVLVIKLLNISVWDTFISFLVFFLAESVSRMSAWRGFGPHFSPVLSGVHAIPPCGSSMRGV